MLLVEFNMNVIEPCAKRYVRIVGFTQHFGIVSTAGQDLKIRNDGEKLEGKKNDEEKHFLLDDKHYSDTEL